MIQLVDAKRAVDTVLARTSDSRVLEERAARHAELLRRALLLMGSRGSAACAGPQPAARKDIHTA